MEYFFEGIGCISTYTIIIKTTFLSGFKKDLKEVPKSFRTFLLVGLLVEGACDMSIWLGQLSSFLFELLPEREKEDVVKKV